MSEVNCAVPGCNNTLTQEQKDAKMTVCSECEAAEMHLCESCGKRMNSEKIKEGATFCKNCESNPTEFEEPEMQNYEEKYLGQEESEDETEDFMV